MLVVVTGSSHGIGHAITTKLVGRGHVVYGISRSPQVAFINFYPIQRDVRDWSGMSGAAKQIGAADALICCAGIQAAIGSTVSTDPEEWSATVSTNLLGTYHAIRAFHPILGGLRRKIICFSGGGATKGRPNFSAYSVSKAAVVRLVETIADEEGSSLDINAVAPGRINTVLSKQVIDAGPIVAGEVEFNAAKEQLSNGGQSIENALALVEWLLSASSDGITGKLISAQWDDFWRVKK